MSVSEAPETIVKETPLKYDEKVVAAWVDLIRSVGEHDLTAGTASSGSSGAKNKRKFPRFPIKCPGRAHPLEMAGKLWQERAGIAVVAHNISRCGLGFLSQTPIASGEHVRVYLQGKGSLKRVTEGVTIRCREYRDGWYEIGLQHASLEAELSETEIEDVNKVVAAA